MPKNKKSLKPEILERLGNGEDLAEICEALGLSVRTIQDWNTKDDDFRLLYTSVADRQEEKKGIFADALEKSLGVVQTACRKSGIPRTTYYNWRKKDPSFAKRCDEIQDIALDFAEDALFLSIQKGNVASIIFYLKTKGKERGYVERQEIVGTQSNPIKVSLNLTKDDLFSDDPDPKDTPEDDEDE